VLFTKLLNPSISVAEHEYPLGDRTMTQSLTANSPELNKS
jgi:hypothetical protein